MDTNTFSLEEIRRELGRLGYEGLSKQTLLKFQNDLDELAQKEKRQDLFEVKKSGSRLQSNVDFTIHQPSPSDNEYNRNDDDNESLDETNTPTISSFHYRPKLNEDDNQSDTSSQKVIKRKVLRHYNGRPTVCDESRSETGSVLDSRDSSYLNDLNYKQKRGRRRIESASDIDNQSTFSEDTRSTLSIHPVKSFIRPSTASTASLRRSRSFSSSHVDSVQLYSYYRQQWASQRAPGEKSHQSLRWAVRDQLLQKDVPVKRKSMPRVNNYVVPTSKKRSALRWNIRYSLANGLQPSRDLDDFLY
ncbi:unnamed protein product [Rotaria socialis]|uniref:Centriolar and ciliogenesis-associated protein HYLS1 C-terminal domain-containing protein n=1 Tax=Rotaria socialis TaxID=392032 RepID=A0A820SG39_9BILA|nr:unnamed protein product [Rotaria socialis]CAF3382325.1 unnamed protein product [Rotaria socialis]CAF3399625.1 unnamed protein product [Rotaria socialis]CAF3418422.1 unnamed protein product [Rotaria socialis]CAF3787864.1 unnamed protein product [Rotaria socialis]